LAALDSYFQNFRVMEYDTDRLVKPLYKAEIFYWILAFLFYPLVNFVSFFYKDVIFLPILLLVSLLLFPFYFLYAKAIIPWLFFSKRHIWFGFISVGVYGIIIALLRLLYSFVHLDENPLQLLQSFQPYFTFSSSTFIRESLWLFINIIFATGIAFLRKNFDEKDIIAKLEKDNANFKLKYLRSQLNPHFFFNTLNSIYSLSLRKSDKTPEVVVKLADLMRYMIYDCDEEKILLDKEIEFIRNYIDIEKIRYKADVRFSVEGETKGIMIEPFLFISFIENGFKHAFNNSYKDAFIYVTIKTAPGQIILNVINNTDLDLETQAKKMPGTGIKNSRSLLELVYPESYALDIIQTDKDEIRKSDLRITNAKKRLETLYPDSHTLDVILSKNAYTVSLLIKTGPLDKMHDS
jgi:two-component system LytT family sensor kinase